MISNYASLVVGDTALLTCVGYGQPDVQITWSRNNGNNNIVNGSLISIYEEEVTQGGRLFTQSFLELCSVEIFDTGNYTCSVSNGQAAAIGSTQIFISGKKCYYRHNVLKIIPNYPQNCLLSLTIHL